MNRLRAGGVLLVCDANVCRSPAAQFVMATRFDADEAFRRVAVASAGVRAGDEPVGACPLVIGLRDDAAWRERAALHRSRPLDEGAVRSATLILTAARSSRGAVAALVPDARRRLFTMREALWLSEGYRRDARVSGTEAVAAFAAHLDRSRGLRPMPAVRRRWWRRPEDPAEIADGHVLGGAAHPAAVRQVEEVAERLAKMMMGFR